MGEVVDAGHWLPADASKSGRASSNLLDAGAEVNKCGICSTEVVNRGVLDCCAHWFCFACIDDWATVTNLCPLCKARFRFITCLPVGYGDSNDPDNIGAGFAKRVDGSADDEGNFPFSFPSYFIDEEAVVCLEGNACRVRAGLPPLEAEGTLAADTSVACDLCDCWYHAGCVNFDPEQSSFYCPRCVAIQEKPKNSWHDTGESGTRISSEARASSLVGLLPPAEKELSYGGGTVVGSTSVAIAVAEKGESAVSLSMRRIPVQRSAPQRSAPFKTAREENKEVMWSPIREPKEPKSYAPPIWSPIREPLNIASQDYNLWSPTPGPINLDDDDEEQLWSPTPESERASCSIFKDQSTSEPVVSANSAARADSMVHDKMLPEVSTCVADGGPHLSKRPLAATRASHISSVEVESRNHVAPNTGPSIRPEGFSISVGGVKKDEKILIESDSVHAHTAVEQLKKGKRRALQEDERRIDSNDLPEPPRKVTRKSSKKIEPVGRMVAAGKDSLNETVAEEHAGDNPDDPQSKDQCSIPVKDPSKEVPTEEIAIDQQIDDRQLDHNINQAENEKTSEEDGKSHVDVMDIVSDPRNRLATETGERSTNQKGVRTRIIMHRETDADDTMGSGLVDRIRQQMRATAGYTRGDDVSKVEVSDDRFLAAFKAALVSSREKSKDTKSTASRNGNPLWLAKIMNRKSQVKGSRESLTKKLYGGGTGRWDRDWDIAFWKERSAHLRKAQEAQDEIKSLGAITGKLLREDGMKPEEDPIFSRIYVADTSLFPRNDDVQLVSAQGKNAAIGGGKRVVKAPQLSLDKDRLQRSVSINRAKTQGSGITSTSSSKDGSLHGKGTALGVSVKANVGLGGKLGPSPKSSSKAGLVQPQASEASTASPTESTTSHGDAKKDKRQWALEVLARKTGTSSIGSSSTGSAKTTESSDNRDGQFSLLVQLPVEMRPLLQHNRHSKVPTAVRQVQLNRMVEQELRRAELWAIGNSPECEEAVNRAKAREEELCKRSNSRGVYVNLCVRSLAQTDAAAKVVQLEPEVDHSDAIQKALEATGLVETPPTSPSNGQGDDCSLATSTSNAAMVPHSKVSGDKPPDSREDECVENVLEMGNLDTYGDFELNLGNYSEDPIPSENFPSSEPEAPTSIQASASGIKRMTVVLASVSNAAPEPAKAPPVTPLGATPQPKEMTQDGDTKVDSLTVPETSVQAHPQMERVDFDGGLEGKLTSVPIGTDMVVEPKNHSVHELPLAILPYEGNPHLSSRNEDLKKSPSRRSDGREKNVQKLSDVNISQSTPTQPAIQNMDDWMTSGKFADLDRRIENIRQSTSPSLNREIDVPWSSSRTNVELGSQNELLTPQQSVQKQVEIYVNQHLKPLYRSGVINSDQFRYTVSKTAAKVMEHHENATSADFLIVEGSKVKKLADQYLQNYIKRKVK